MTFEQRLKRVQEQAMLISGKCFFRPWQQSVQGPEKEVCLDRFSLKMLISHQCANDFLETVSLPVGENSLHFVFTSKTLI